MGTLNPPNLSRNGTSKITTNTPTVVLIGSQNIQQEKLTLLGKNISKLLNKHFMNVNDLLQEIHTSNNEISAYHTQQLEVLNTVISNNKHNTIISFNISPNNNVNENEFFKKLFQIFKSNSIIVIHAINSTIGNNEAFELNLETCSAYEFYLNNCPVNHKPGDESVCKWLIKIEYQLTKFIQNCYTKHYTLLETIQIKSNTTSPTLLFHSFPFEIPTDTNAPCSKINDWGNSDEVNEPNMLELHLMINNLLELLESRKTIQQILRVIGQQDFLFKCFVRKLPIILTFTKSKEVICVESWLIEFINALVVSVIKWNVDVFCIDEVSKTYLTEKSVQELVESKIVTGTVYKGSTLDIVLQKSRRLEESTKDNSETTSSVAN